MATAKPKQYRPPEWLMRNRLKCQLSNANKTIEFLQRVVLAAKVVPIILRLSERFEAVPHTINGFHIRTTAIRCYMGRVMLGWSIDVTVQALDVSNWSVITALRRVEEARDEPWFDEFLTTLEEDLKKETAEHYDDITKIAESTKLATPLGTK